MVQRLIVPVDGSPNSWLAADVATSLARRLGAIVHLVEVVAAPHDVRDAEARLNDGLRNVDADDVEVELDVRLSADTVASSVDELIKKYPGAIVVLASHGRGRSAALVGSVADDVLRRSFGPILVVGPNATTSDFTGPLVVSVDGSDESERALPLAAAWAIELGVSPWVTHVVAPTASLPPSEDLFDSAYPARLADELSILSGHRAEFEELHEGHPTVAVPEFAESLGASMIVAASHGRSGLSRLTMGSVTAGFVRHASCPVLLIRLPIPANHTAGNDAQAWAF